METRSVKEQIKDHIRNHLVIYTLGIAGITVLIMRSTTARGGVGEDNARGGLINAASLIFSNKL